MPRKREIAPEGAALIRAAIGASGRTKRDFARDVIVCGEPALYRWLRGDSMPPVVVLEKCRRLIAEQAARA